VLFDKWHEQLPEMHCGCMPTKEKENSNWHSDSEPDGHEAGFRAILIPIAVNHWELKMRRKESQGH
jgi:hypothetical protein